MRWTPRAVTMFRSSDSVADTLPTKPPVHANISLFYILLLLNPITNIDGPIFINTLVQWNNRIYCPLKWEIHHLYNWTLISCYTGCWHIPWISFEQTNLFFRLFSVIIALSFFHIYLWNQRLLIQIKTAHPLL